MKLTSYLTYDDARNDGWVPARSLSEARDVSGPNAFGYTYALPNGARSTSIWCSQERNQIGRLGAFWVMFHAGQLS